MADTRDTLLYILVTFWVLIGIFTGLFLSYTDIEVLTEGDTGIFSNAGLDIPIFSYITSLPDIVLSLLGILTTMSIAIGISYLRKG